MRCNSCGYNFEVFINYRRHHRKNTILSGSCSNHDFFQGENNIVPEDVTEIIIHNISRNGVGFTLKTSINLSIGDVLNIRFLLDNKKKSMISKKVVVRRITNNYIAAEFTGYVDENDKDLAFYLL
jgi:monomeric isocitrate dehydrogenase